MHHEFNNSSNLLCTLYFAGTLVVADLTDPMLQPDEACGVFQVLLEQFREHSLDSVGKVVAFDEAHKYLNNAGPGCIELANAIVDTVRKMRHEAIRVLISTQSPMTMPPELLELASATILHQFQSSEWCTYLASKITLPPHAFEHIKELNPGEALLLSTKIAIPAAVSTEVDAPSAANAKNLSCLMLNMRPRLTADLGASICNKAVSTTLSTKATTPTPTLGKKLRHTFQDTFDDDGQESEYSDDIMSI